MRYPESRIEPVVDLLHGVEVPDPYRWLENGESEETRAWTEHQNTLTRETLAAVPERAALASRLAELLSTGTITAPTVRKGRLFYQRREGSQNQPVLCWREGPEGEEHVLLDPALYEKDAAAALDWWYPSPDGRLLAYGISRGGDEKSTLGVRIVVTGEDLEDRIPHTRYSSLAWLPDSSGFYYTRYPVPGTLPEGEENYWRKLHLHRLGDNWQDDPIIFGEGRAREEMLGVDLSPNGRWLCVTVHRGWAENDVYLLDRTHPRRGFRAVVEGIPALFHPEALNDRIYLRTNHEAPNYRIFQVDPEHPARKNWQEIVPESTDVLDGHACIGELLVCDVLRNASSALLVRTPDGRLLREVELPGIGTVAGWGGEWDQPNLYFGFVSFTTPPRVYHHHVYSGETTLWRAIQAPLNPDEYVVRQVWYPSRDGTQISMFLVHRRDITPDGNRPTLLYGYGGFNASITPSLIRGAMMLLERGGVYALANLRGGGEYGEDWHRAGMLGEKQNVFDDCIAAAEYLIAQGYTRPERLAVQGGSNGGLLVGAVVTQRPDLFRAAVCQVPLLDMVRYHLFSIARLWIPEYGSSEDPEQFRWLYTYSPYHQIRDGVAYPAMLITAAEADTRVDPLHARKFAARMQAATAGEAPILLRIETRAGHGAGKPLSKIIEEGTDVWSFLFSQLGV